jgi:hypothetical protein
VLAASAYVKAHLDVLKKAYIRIAFNDCCGESKPDKNPDRCGE